MYMVPCLNPDGFEYSRLHYSFWRKNRRDNGDGTFGIDLNRNFDVNFRKSNNTDSNIMVAPTLSQSLKRKQLKTLSITNPISPSP